MVILLLVGYFTPRVDCEVSEWGPCDPLTGKRKRKVIKEKQGWGKDCPALEEDCPVNCVMEVWGPCVDGKQTRKITTEAKNGGTACGSLEQNCPVDCVMSDWGECYGNKQKRVIISEAKNGGKACGSVEQNCVQVCDKNKCNAVIDSYKSRNWAYTSSSFGECGGCPIVSYPNRL